MSHSQPRRLVRAALTETINAYDQMPASVDEIHTLADRLEEIRRANVEHHIQLMSAARAQEAQVICFGELFTAPYFALSTDPMWLPMAEDAQSGPTVRRLQEAAKEHQMIVVAPIYEYDSAQDQRYNTAVVIDEHGRYLGKFRKAHIPYGSNEQGEFHENFYYGRSDANNEPCPGNVSKDPLFPVFETSLGNIGVAICYDRHFPYVMWTLAKQGAELIFCPSITFGSKSERMWNIEFPTDAARHNIYIGGSNRRGKEPPWTQHYYGQSYFVGPNGKLYNLSSHPDLVVSDVDLDSLCEADPSGWNVARDSRPEWPLDYNRRVRKEGTAGGPPPGPIPVVGQVNP